MQDAINMWVDEAEDLVTRLGVENQSEDSYEKIYKAPRSQESIQRKKANKRAAKQRKINRRK